MNQDRNTEYKDNMKDLCDYPEELENVKNRLNSRIKKRNARRFITSLSAFVGVATLFTAAVNTSTAFAQTINRIPIISNLAEFVKFDKGLQNFVNNQYVQEVNLEQEVNGLTLKMPYVIADSKRLVLFFQLPDAIVDQNNSHEYQVVVDNDLRELDIRSVIYRRFKDETARSSNELHIISIRSDQAVIPQDITLPISLVKLNSTTGNASIDPTILANYEFKLHLNDYREPIINVLDQEVQVLDQTVLIRSVTEYPTGVEIIATAPNNNDTIISGLQFVGIDEDGNSWKIPEGTTPAITYSDEAVDIIYYLENDYFSDASLDRVEITGVGMFKKVDKMVTVDLVNQTITPAISDLYIKSVKRDRGYAIITFESTIDDLDWRDVVCFSDRYEDLQGNVHFMDIYQSSGKSGGKMQYFVTVPWPEDNQLVLERYKSPVIKLENPVSISLSN